MNYFFMIIALGLSTSNSKADSCSTRVVHDSAERVFYDRYRVISESAFDYPWMIGSSKTYPGDGTSNNLCNPGEKLFQYTHTVTKTEKVKGKIDTYNIYFKLSYLCKYNCSTPTPTPTPTPKPSVAPIQPSGVGNNVNGRKGILEQ